MELFQEMKIEEKNVEDKDVNEFLGELNKMDFTKK